MLVFEGAGAKGAVSEQFRLGPGASGFRRVPGPGGRETPFSEENREFWAKTEPFLALRNGDFGVEIFVFEGKNFVLYPKNVVLWVKDNVFPPKNIVLRVKRDEFPPKNVVLWVKGDEFPPKNIALWVKRDEFHPKNGVLWVKGGEFPPKRGVF